MVNLSRIQISWPWIPRINLKSLLVGMVVFDLFLHIWPVFTGADFVVWNYYNGFWITYWSLFLIMLTIEFSKEVTYENRPS